MKKQNIILIVVLVVLTIVNIIIFNWESSTSSTNYDAAMFAIEDTTSIQVIRIAGNEVNIIDRASNWRLNDAYASDPNLRRILMAVLNRVRVSLMAGSTVNQELQSRMDQAIEVEVGLEGGKTIDFSVLGNSTQTRSYFISEGIAYEVEIPGYRDYVAGIFQLTTDQWRDRLVFNGNWRTIQQLEIVYDDQNEAGLSISFDQEFFRVQGVEQIDSSGVVGYLEEFTFLQANERVSPGKIPRYDSLKNTVPIASISIEDIKYPQQIILKIYPALPNEQIQLVIDQHDEMMFFDSRRLKNLLINTEDLRF